MDVWLAVRHQIVLLDMSGCVVERRAVAICVFIFELVLVESWTSCIGSEPGIGRRLTAGEAP